MDREPEDRIASTSDEAARVAAYLHREVRLPPSEADARAADLLVLIGLRHLASVAGPLVRHWWLLLLRGLLAILFGVLALAQPYAALAAVVLVFGVWAFVDGVAAIALAIAGQRSWHMLVVGLIGIAAGVLTFARPGITALALYAIVSAWAIARGTLEIALAIRLRREVSGEVWLVLGGIASIAFGVLLVALPAAGVLTVAWLIGLYALFIGVITVALSFRLRSLSVAERRISRQTPAPQPG
jgi:uncharacterized membrane protein HdeD (DUF308 family)